MFPITVVILSTLLVYVSSSTTQSPDQINVDNLILKAKITKLLGRYGDMAAAMREVILAGHSTLTSEERSMLANAYENMTDPKRSSWRDISNMELEASDREKEVMHQVREKVENEIQDICNEVLDLLQVHLLPHIAEDDIERGSKATEDKVLYLTMEGNYMRYLAEIDLGDDRNKKILQSQEAYKRAYNISKEQLAPSHPIRLGLALSFSFFYYEIRNSPEKACVMAREAFDSAISALDELDVEDTEESSRIMKLLRKNVRLLCTYEIDEETNEDA